MMHERGGYSRERSYPRDRGERGDRGDRGDRGEHRGEGRGQLEHAIADALRALSRLRRMGGIPPALEPLCQLAPREGLDVHVTLRGARRSEDGESRGPEVLLSYRPAEHGRGGHHDDYGGEDEEPVPAVDPEIALRDLLRLVAQSEQDPRLQFIALKLLRDRILPASGAAWAGHPKVCQAVIGDAINRELLITRKVPNPRNPDFPVTAIVLNRDNPALAQYLDGMPPPPKAADAPEASHTAPEDDDDVDEDEDDAEFADEAEDEATGTGTQP